MNTPSDDAVRLAFRVLRNIRAYPHWFKPGEGDELESQCWDVLKFALPEQLSAYGLTPSDVAARRWVASA